MAEIVVAGHVCLDIIPTIPSNSELTAGSLIVITGVEMTPGGCVPNVGLALKQLDVAVSLIGKVGTDNLGDVLISRLSNHGPELAASFVPIEGGVTSTSVVLNIPGRDRTFLHMPGENNTFCAEDVPIEALSDAKIFHFGYPPVMSRMYADDGAELEKLFRRVRANGVATSLDMSLPDPKSDSAKVNWARILERVLPHVDFFFPSDGELRFMLGPLGTVEHCVRLGAGVVVEKRGGKGLRARTATHPRVASIRLLANPEAWADQAAEHSCFAVDVMGTTGAGDATIAGFLMGALRGFNLDQCLSAGCAVGACSVEAVDAVSGIPSWQEVEKRMNAGWRTIEAE